MFMKILSHFGLFKQNVWVRSTENTPKSQQNSMKSVFRKSSTGKTFSQNLFLVVLLSFFMMEL